MPNKETIDKWMKVIEGDSNTKTTKDDVEALKSDWNEVGEDINDVFFGSKNNKYKK